MTQISIQSSHCEQSLPLNTQCGFIAIIGRPNVGKSTLINYLMGEKISITCRKPQTTQRQILGVKTKGHQQIVLIDTPGLQAKNVRKRLNQAMNQQAKQALIDVEKIMFVIEGDRWTDLEQDILELLKSVSCPVIAVINKIDLIYPKSKLLELIKSLQTRFAFSDIIPVSAQNGLQVDQLEHILFSNLPEGPHHFPEETLTDQSDHRRASEIIREKCVRFLGDELPFSIAVEIESYAPAKKHAIQIHANIWVTRDSQRKIVIGQGGQAIKRIGIQARQSLMDWLKTTVHLKLFVKVQENWVEDPKALNQLELLMD